MEQDLLGQIIIDKSKEEQLEVWSLNYNNYLKNFHT